MNLRPKIPVCTDCSHLFAYAGRTPGKLGGTVLHYGESYCTKRKTPRLLRRWRSLLRTPDWCPKWVKPNQASQSQKTDQVLHSSKLEDCIYRGLSTRVLDRVKMIDIYSEDIIMRVRFTRPHTEMVCAELAEDYTGTNA